jgi:hypothetical protein
MSHPAHDPVIRDAAALMDGYGGHWGVAGGWAVDLYVGRQTRPHADLDIAVLRSEQPQLQRQLAGADVNKVDLGCLRPWETGEVLSLPTHEIHATWPNGRTLEFLLNDLDDATSWWVFRRDSRVRRPIELVIRTTDGVPHLSPEIVLLYKAKQRGEKDEADLASVLPLLGAEPRRWLVSAIELAHGRHPWLDPLTRDA